MVQQVQRAMLQAEKDEKTPAPKETTKVANREQRHDKDSAG